MPLSRRSLITGLVSLVAAPAIVRAGSLMPIKANLVVFREIYGATIIEALAPVHVEFNKTRDLWQLYPTFRNAMRSVRRDGDEFTMYVGETLTIEHGQNLPPIEWDQKPW